MKEATLACHHCMIALEGQNLDEEGPMSAKEIQMMTVVMALFAHRLFFNKKKRE